MKVNTLATDTPATSGSMSLSAVQKLGSKPPSDSTGLINPSYALKQRVNATQGRSRARAKVIPHPASLPTLPTESGFTALIYDSLDLLTQAQDYDDEIENRSLAYDEWKDSLGYISQGTEEIPINHRAIVGTLSNATRNQEYHEINDETFVIITEAMYLLRTSSISDYARDSLQTKLLEQGLSITLDMHVDDDATQLAELDKIIDAYLK